jgi:hypothetical protein
MGMGRLRPALVNGRSNVKIATRIRRPATALSATALSATIAGNVMLLISVVLAQTPAVPAAQLSANGGPLAPAAPNEHPLMPALRWAKEGLPAIENLKDYSAVFAKRERIRGKLGGYEYLFIKIRHQPFSVYAHFQAPAAVKGQEVIYVAGRNQGNLLAHKARLPATVSLDPAGLIAMNGRHYPLTEIGLVNLVRRLVEVGRQDVNYGECEVKYFTQAKVNERSCTVVQVVHPVPRDTFRFHLARVFVDDELMVPIRYESHDWPREPGGQPELIEEYTYLDLKLNNGFTDEDFSTRNPEYHFQATATEPRHRKESR